MHVSDPNVPPLVDGLVIVTVLVIYAFGGLGTVIVMAALSDVAMRRVEAARERAAARVAVEASRRNK